MLVSSTIIVAINILSIQFILIVLLFVLREHVFTISIVKKTETVNATTLRTPNFMKYEHTMKTLQRKFYTFFLRKYLYSI